MHVCETLRSAASVFRKQCPSTCGLPCWKACYLGKTDGPLSGPSFQARSRAAAIQSILLRASRLTRAQIRAGCRVSIDV